jgi:hypothetical protein
MTTTCLLAWAAVLLLLPVHLLLWATESRASRIGRLRQRGNTWASIADRYGVSPSTVRRWATA